MSVYLSRMLKTAIRGRIACVLPTGAISPKQQFISIKSVYIPVLNQLSRRFRSSDAIQPTAALENASIPLKKKIVHKKSIAENLSQKEGHFLTLAYATANSYDLKALKEALVEQKLYEPGNLKTVEIGNVVVANAVYNIGSEQREIFFFKEGAVVFWNCSELEASNVLEFVKPYELESYPREVIEKEREIMTYIYQPNSKKCHLQESCFIMVPERDNSLERFAFSHAMAQSARLGAWEARLEWLAAAVRYHTASMEREGAAHVDKKEVVRKLGELFSLRHRLNVESDMLDTPDFYWEEEQLERLYSNTLAYFTIPRRTRVLNERLSHCVELLELLSSWAADRHHIRLEWMIIVLILAEVCFELLHIFERNSFRLDRRRPSPERRPLFSSDLEESIVQEISIIDT